MTEKIPNALVIERMARMTILEGAETYGDIHFTFRAPFAEPPAISPTFVAIAEDANNPAGANIAIKVFYLTAHSPQGCTVRVHVARPPGEGKQMFIRCTAVAIGPGFDSAFRWEDDI